MASKSVEIIFFYIFFFIAAVIGIYFKLDFLSFTVLFTLPPIIYLSLKLKKYFKKILLESLVIAIPLEIILDSIAHLSKSWYVPSVLGIRIFGDMPLDDIIWTFLYVFLILLSYSYLFDHYKSKRLKQSFKKMSLTYLLMLFVFIAINNSFPMILSIPYFYSILMAAALLFTIVFLIKYPRMYQNISLIALYFFLPSVFFEYVALELGHWYFDNGYHLAYIMIGKFSIPLEEFFFYLLAVTSTVLIHEMFGDNKRNT
jgi:hypothetical protein